MMPTMGKQICMKMIQYGLFDGGAREGRESGRGEGDGAELRHRTETSASGRTNEGLNLAKNDLKLLTYLEQSRVLVRLGMVQVHRQPHFSPVWLGRRCCVPAARRTLGVEMVRAV